MPDVGKSHQLSVAFSGLRPAAVMTLRHELCTPLTSILGYTEMLLANMAGELAPEQRAHIGTIAQRGTALLATANGLLDVLALFGEPVVIRRESIAVDVLLSEVIARVRPLAQQKNIELELDLAPEMSTVSVDIEKTRRAVSAVVDNAVKFTGDGGSVRVSLRPSADVRGAFEVVVVDSGIGIPAAALPRVCEPFFQADLSSTRRHGGLGVGLAIAQRLVEAHGGTLRFASWVGSGTTVTLIFADPSP